MSTAIRIRPRRSTSKGCSGSQQHEEGVGGWTQPSPQKRSERQLKENRLRWSVITTVLEWRLEKKKERWSDSLGNDELGEVAKQFALSGSEVRKIWAEYILQRNRQRETKTTEPLSMISNEHGEAVRDGVSASQWTRAAQKRKLEAEDRSTHYRPRLSEKGRLWSVSEMVEAISVVNNTLGQVNTSYQPQLNKLSTHIFSYYL